DGNRVVNPERRGLRPHVGDDVLERELRGVHAHDDETVFGVPRVPRLDVGQGALAVDARIGPEVDQYHLAVQRADRQRLATGGVQPRGDPGEVRRATAVHQPGGVWVAAGQ